MNIVTSWRLHDKYEHDFLFLDYKSNLNIAENFVTTNQNNGILFFYFIGFVWMVAGTLARQNNISRSQSLSHEMRLTQAIVSSDISN